MLVPEGCANYYRDITLHDKSDILVFNGGQTKKDTYYTGYRTIRNALHAYCQNPENIQVLHEKYGSYDSYDGFIKLITVRDNLNVSMSTLTNNGLVKNIIHDVKLWDDLLTIVATRHLSHADWSPGSGKYRNCFIISPDQAVRLSYHDEGPENQAVIWGLRVKPKNIIGMVQSIAPEEDSDWSIRLETAKKMRIPIYDTKGGVIWPKKMARSEVVAMIEANKTPL